MLNLVKQKQPKTFTFEVEKLEGSEVQWYGAEYLIKCTNYGWFPTEMLMGVNKNGRYIDSNNIGATITGNMGSRTIGVKDIKTAKQLLKIK